MFAPLCNSYGHILAIVNIYEIINYSQPFLCVLPSFSADHRSREQGVHLKLQTYTLLGFTQSCHFDLNCSKDQLSGTPFERPPGERAPFWKAT